MQITQKQIDELWGDEGPYSEASLIFEHRILDDSVSRVFIQVRVAINPLTFKIVKQNKKLFKDDPLIIGMIENCVNMGGKNGYVTLPFSAKYEGEERIKKEADRMLELSKAAIIKMHEFVIDLLEIPKQPNHFKIQMI